MVRDVIVIVGEGILLVTGKSENLIAHSGRVSKSLFQSAGDHIQRHQIGAAAALEEGHIQMGIVEQLVLAEIRGLFNNIEVLFKAESKVSGKLLVPVVCSISTPKTWAAVAV